jgi:hypothetical protein
MKRGPHQASPLMVNNRMAGTRITVWDVLHDLETGGARSAMAVTVHLSDAPGDAVAAAIDQAAARGLRSGGPTPTRHGT